MATMIKIAMTEIVHVPEFMSDRWGGQAFRRARVVAGCVLGRSCCGTRGWVSAGGPTRFLHLGHLWPGRPEHPTHSFLARRRSKQLEPSAHPPRGKADRAQVVDGRRGC